MQDAHILGQPGTGLSHPMPCSPCSLLDSSLALGPERTFRTVSSLPTFIEFQSEIIYHASQSQRMSNSRGDQEGHTPQPGAMRSRMSKRAVITLAVMIGMWLGGWERLHAAVERPLSSQVSEQMWERLLTAGTPPLLRVAGDSLRSGHLLLQFYTRRLYWPAWSNDT